MRLSRGPDGGALGHDSQAPKVCETLRTRPMLLVNSCNGMHQRIAIHPSDTHRIARVASAAIGPPKPLAVGGVNVFVSEEVMLSRWILTTFYGILL
jgi:hypothetical protein